MNNISDKWFEVEEQSAGIKRLRLTWFLYKVFGKNILYIIAFIMSLFTLMFSPKIRRYSKKYFSCTQKHLKLKPNLINQFKHIKSYADSLADKILVFSGNYDEKKIVFNSKADKKLLFEDVKKGKGVFFICNHIGNIEILQTFLSNCTENPNFHINIFMSYSQSQIFNNFLQTIKIDFPIRIFQVEDIGINTGIELKENLNNGELVFIAGDRIAQNNNKNTVNVEFLSHHIKLPQGTFKLAKLMNVSTYFISAIKVNNKYHIILKKQNNLEKKEIVKSYAKFMEQVVKINPYQFFHFYDFFN